MTAPDHLKISGPEDILGFIPHSLGYWPVNSVVAMTLQGPRLGATLRVDLPEPGRYRKPALAAFARTVAGYLEADHDADGSLLAVFTGHPPGGAGGSPGPAAGPPEPAQPAAGPPDLGLPELMPLEDGPLDGGHFVRSADGPASRPLDRLVGELESALDAIGLPVRDAWIVGERYWRNAHCTDPACCAPPGRPIDEIRNSIINAELVYRGSRIGAVPGTAAPGGAPNQARPGVLAAERRWEREFSGRWRDRAQLDAVLDVWDCVLDPVLTPALPTPAVRTPPRRRPAGSSGASSKTSPKEASPDKAARITAARAKAARAAAVPGELPDGLAGYLRATLCVAAWRDAVLVLAAAGRPAALAGVEDFGLLDDGPGSPAPRPDFDGFVPGRQAGRKVLPTGKAVRRPAGAAPSEVPAAAPVPGYGEVLLGLEPGIPDWARLAALDRVLQQLGNAGSGEARAAALTARGWIEWCRGRGSYAAALYQEAAREWPGYRLADLLGELARRGTLCGWAARKESAWQKFDPDAA